MSDKNIKKKSIVNEKIDPNEESGFRINPKNKFPTIFIIFEMLFLYKNIMKV